MPGKTNRGNLIGLFATAALLLAAMTGASIWMIRAYLRPAAPPVALSSEQIAPVAPPILGPPPPADAVPIGGTVHDDQGQPIARAQVQLDWRVDVLGANGTTTSDYHSEQAYTDAKGHWSFNRMPHEAIKSLVLQLSNKDFVSLEVDGPPERPLLAGDSVNILSRGFDVSGQVVDESGRPVGGVRVTTAYTPDDSSKPTARSDGGGHFVIHHVRGGAARLLAIANGYAPSVGQATAGENAAPAVVIVAAGQTLRGRIVDESSKPLANALTTLGYWNGENLSLHARSDGRGRFEMPDLPQGPIEIKFSLTGYQDHAVHLSPGQDEPVITLKLLPVFSGRVTDAVTGKPIAEFRALSGALWPHRRLPLFTFGRPAQGNGGQYTLKSGGFGGEVLDWYVRVEADGYLPAISSPVSSGGPLTQDFELRPSSDIRVQVIDPDGKPAAGARMMMTVAGCGASIFQNEVQQRDQAAQLGTVDAQGRFSFRPQLAPFEIWAVGDAGCAQSRMLEFDGKPIEMKLVPWAEVRLRSNVADTLKPESVAIDMQQADDPMNMLNFSYLQYNARPDDKGIADFPRLPATFPGELAIAKWYVEGSGPISGGRAGVVQLNTGQTTEVDLTRGVTVSGRFVPADAAETIGKSGGRLTIQAIPDAPPSQWPVDWLEAARASPAVFCILTDTDSAGRFTVAGLSPGRYEISWVSNADPQSCCGAGVMTVPANAGEFIAPDMQYAKYARLKVGEAAPEVLGRTLDDKPIRTSDFAGKFVVWMIHDSGIGVRDGQTPSLGALAAQFVDDSRVALLADNAERVTSGYSCPARRPPALSQPGWTNGYLSLIDQPLYLAMAVDEQNGPKLCVISPDGKIAAMGLPADKTGDTLNELLANPRRSQ